MIRIFGREKTGRQVPKCPECKLDDKVGLSTYMITPEGDTERYWECYRCNCVIKKARD